MENEPTRFTGFEVKESSWFGIARAMVLAILRYRASRACEKWASRGLVVITDRWPGTALGKMDGPSLVTQPTSSYAKRKLSDLEQTVYRNIAPADACIFLKVSLQTALERNRNRTKEDKETDSEIVRRYKQSDGPLSAAKKQIIFDNDGPFELKRVELQNVVWGILADEDA